MKIRIYQTSGGKFQLLLSEKSVVLGISNELDTQVQALTLALGFMQNHTLDVQNTGAFYTPVFQDNAGAITFVRTQSPEQAGRIAELANTSMHKLYEKVYADPAAALATSVTKVASKAAAAIRKLKKGMGNFDLLAYGLVECTLGFLPTNEEAQVMATTDETVFGQVVAAGSLPTP